jgi:hypothetical protein
MKPESKMSIKALLRHQRPTMLKDASVRRTVATENFRTVDFHPSREKSSSTRHLANGEKKMKRPMEPYIRSKSAILRNQFDLSNDRNALNFKAAAFSRATKPRVGSTVLVKQAETELQVKVGIFGSQSRLGQTVQAVGTVALPGDTSEIRSPIRSRLYSALIPGGGGGRRIPRPNNERGYRCPAGFQHGGRFTDRNYSTCGAQLFELALNAAVNALRGDKPAIGQANAQDVSRVVEGANAQQSRAIQIMRMAKVPRSGAENPKVRSAAVAQVIKAITGSPSGESRLIRKDGIILRSLVPSSVLRNFGGNPDMENGVFVRSIDKPTDIVGDDLALLSGPAIRQVAYVTPNGSVLSIERQRDLTVGERRKFGRQLNNVAGASDQYDVGNNIREFANASGGAFKYSEQFPNVPKPLDLIEVEDANGNKKEVRRWVYETFMKDSGKTGKLSARVEKQTLREDGASVSDSPKTLVEAVELIDNGGDPFDISPEFLSDAMRRSKKYQPRKLGTGITEYSDGSGKTYYQIPETKKNGAIAERYYSDIASQLGIPTPAVRFIGKEGSRESFSGDVANDGNRIDFNEPYSKVAADDMLRAFIADYLTDARDRSPATLRPVRTQQKLTVVPSGNELSALAGLSSEEIKKRFNIDLPTYIENRSSKIYKDRFGSLSAKERNELLGVYDTLIDRAKKFKWDEYASRLSADGNLSPAEQAHLDILKKLFTARLDRLVRGKQQTIKLLGI